MNQVSIAPYVLPAELDALRMEVRDFLAEELRDYPAVERAKNWFCASPAFSQKLGAKGWIGMTWPKRCGGAERTALERYVVLEELLAAGAPLEAHWVADRQSGPMLLNYSPDVLAPRILPDAARGLTYFCIGMSEPDSGSDLASIRTKAVRTGTGWAISGSKIWTSGAHHAHYMIALVRTRSPEAGKHRGLSQFVIDMSLPGITMRPIINQVGVHDFNLVTFDGVEVPDECLLGQEGDGWQQVTSELAIERSGPERYLSSTQLMIEMVGRANSDNERHATEIGTLVAEYATLRQMSLGVAGLLEEKREPALEAALVKDLGANLEQAIPQIAHELYADGLAGTPLGEVIAYTTQAAVSYSLRGGTREVLRGIVARHLGMK